MALATRSSSLQGLAASSIADLRATDESEGRLDRVPRQAQAQLDELCYRCRLRSCWVAAVCIAVSCAAGRFWPCARTKISRGVSTGSIVSWASCRACSNLVIAGCRWLRPRCEKCTQREGMSRSLTSTPPPKTCGAIGSPATRHCPLARRGAQMANVDIAEWLSLRQTMMHFSLQLSEETWTVR